MTAGRWVITCDPGIDDAVALAVAAGWDGAEVAAVVAGAGNVDAATAWRNAAGIVALLGLDVAVAVGSAVAVDGTPIHRPGDVHGPDGLGGLAARLPAVAPAAIGDAPSDAAQVGHASDDAVGLVRGDVVATGPLTDLALAVRRGNPVARVVWLGGSVAGLRLLPPALAGDPGTGEFNAAVDPGAVTEVLQSLPTVAVVPIEVSRRVALTGADIERLATGTGPARFIADLARTRLGPAGVVLHDPVAVVAALDPGLFRWDRLALRCGAGGALVPDRRDTPTARVAVDIDTAAVRGRIVAAVLSCAR